MSSEAIDALKVEISRRAKERAEKILKDAGERAEKLLREAEKKAEKLLQERAEPQILAIRKRILGKASMECKKMLLEAKEEMISKALSRVFERLKRFPEEDEYRAFLKRSLKRALKVLGPRHEGKLLIYLNERDFKIIREEISGADLKLVKADLIGGLIASTEDGSVIFNDSLESRLEALKPMLRDIIASTLFEEVERRT